MISQSVQIFYPNYFGADQNSLHFLAYHLLCFVVSDTRANFNILPNLIMKYNIMTFWIEKPIQYHAFSNGILCRN